MDIIGFINLRKSDLKEPDVQEIKLNFPEFFEDFKENNFKIMSCVSEIIDDSIFKVLSKKKINGKVLIKSPQYGYYKFANYDKVFGSLKKVEPIEIWR